MPPSSPPPFCEWAGTVLLPVAADGWVSLPQSGEDLTILSLQAEPAFVDERFVAGRRQIHVPPGCQELRLHLHYRAWASDPAALPTPQHVLPEGVRFEAAP
ncbi:MAG: hypothetical protein IPK26_04905 [Planctomycetes bacterium]|nr:hypothetical protein [Planctomycetota bacterium]